MKTSGVEKKHFIFYFYPVRKIYTIKEKLSDKDSPEGKKLRSNFQVILEKVGIAAGLTLLIYYTVFYVYFGKLYWVTKEAMLEMSLEFAFLLLLFMTHRQIAKIFSKSVLEKVHPAIKRTLELITVILTAMILHYLIDYYPLTLLYDEQEFPPVNVRNGYVINVIVALFFYYFVETRKRERQLQKEKLRSARLQKENFQAQLESLKQQVNPHFLFNSLNVLGSLVYSDQDKAVDFIRKLSDLYRSYLDHGAEMLISLKKELEVCQAYTYLLETRFGDAVQFEFKIPDDKLSLLLPPGSLQMLIENAVKHNGSTTSRPLKVEILTENDSLVVRNGLNPRKEKIISTKTGLENIKNRYRYLTDEQVKIEKSENEFMVKLPLLKVEDYENSDY
ncbi:sensor histidine kinase [Christiangramia crocea]|uniref:Histidine kinase n=1 Tax=Christiangramia crocea TaxID=2904124 RepID=A0A9X2A530_9FLAO|nr:sensor histidine kinase [Gramella crocea]MCG9970875.1 histidine kinase [Gramella crocea]